MLIKPLAFEQWEDIDFLDIKRDLYQISNFGEVKNKVTGRILSTVKSQGYPTLQLQTINGTRKTYYVHDLVAIKFVFNQYPKIRTVPNHLDRNRDNNCYLNLEWSTPIENNHHAIMNKDLDIAKPTPKGENNWSKGELTAGENNGMSIWTDAQVHKICQALEMGYNYGEALIYAGLENTENNRFNVSHIVQGKRWKSISKLYNMPKTRTFTDYSIYAEEVCKLLSIGKSTREIINLLEIPGKKESAAGFINRIKRRQAYTAISYKYNW